MRIPKIYLETSVFNFVFADDAPEKKQDTLKLFEEIRQGRYVPYASSYVTGELDDAPEPKRTNMLNLIEAYKVKILPANPEAERLAEAYIREKIITEKNFVDARHIAITVVNGLDFIVSLNFRHIVKRKTIEMTELVNYREGYKKVGIYTPMEVIDDNDEEI